MVYGVRRETVYPIICRLQIIAKGWFLSKRGLVLYRVWHTLRLRMCQGKPEYPEKAQQHTYRYSDRSTCNHMCNTNPVNKIEKKTILRGRGAI